MPYSDSRFDVKIAKLIRRWSYHYYLDIGAGAGKYGLLIREQFPRAYVEAVEANAAYAREFELSKIYDHVAVVSAIEIVDRNPDYHTECVIIGDTIEHLRKSEGTDLLHYLLYRAKTIVVVVPDRYVQYSCHGHSREAHLSAWSRKDFRGFRHRWYEKGYMRLAVLAGYLGDEDAVVTKTVEELLRVHRPISDRGVNHE